ncbi:MAG: PD40 domain-containing protein [Anaerolineae bacterium]|nr:PD40 domain-containing protein [Anaerolineae bacterium]
MILTRMMLALAAVFGAAFTVLASIVEVAAAAWMRGDEIAFVSYLSFNADIFVVDVNHGLVYNLTNDDAYDVAPAWSPDGEWIAFASNRDGRRNIYVTDRLGRNVRRLTDEGGIYSLPRWSADGGSLLFTSLTDDGSIYSVDIDGSNFHRLDDPDDPGNIVVDLAYEPGSLSRMFSPDGSNFAFMTYRNQAWGIYLSENASRRDARLLVDIGRFTEQPSWSPDGKRMAYTAVRDGLIDLYVIDVDGAKPPKRLTFNREIDVSPAWRP